MIFSFNSESSFISFNTCSKFNTSKICSDSFDFKSNSNFLRFFVRFEISRFNSNFSVTSLFLFSSKSFFIIKGATMIIPCSIEFDSNFFSNFFNSSPILYFSSNISFVNLSISLSILSIVFKIVSLLSSSSFSFFQIYFDLNMICFLLIQFLLVLNIYYYLPLFFDLTFFLILQTLQVYFVALYVYLLNMDIDF